MNKELIIFPDIHGRDFRMDAGGEIYDYETGDIVP